MADAAVEEALRAGAGYADARVLRRARRAILVKNGNVASLEEEEQLGLAVRALSGAEGGAWGFVATSDLSEASVARAAREALAQARATASAGGAVRLAPQQPVEAAWATPIVIDPWSVPLSEQVDLLRRADAAMRTVRGIGVSEACLRFERRDQRFVSSEGARIDQSIIHTGAGICARAFKDGVITRRSYPNSAGGQHAARGYELALELDLPGNAHRIAGEAVALLDAPPCPSGEMDIILGGAMLALQIHESIGHPTELDRILGWEAVVAGTSYLGLEDLGSFRLGSPLVNVVADARPNHGPGVGTFGFDDEGVPSSCVDIVRNGVVVGATSGRESAAAAGLAQSGGAVRAEGWDRFPLVRMTNVSLLPGAGTLADLVADTREGMLLDTDYSWSIDDKRLNFQFGTEIGWRIRGGRVAEMVRGATYGGVSPSFWSAFDAVCGPEEWNIWGLADCGKGHPMQSMSTGHGAAPARFRGVRVGFLGGS
ncbi:MAG: TldD/PmbA family protein [Deltaproteobacteria bacterium]|nr:TldD/PmbA family protein [Deltaproteobacteria bacterium]